MNLILETRLDNSGQQFIQEWHVPLPMDGLSFTVTRDEWLCEPGRLPVRKIFAWIYSDKSHYYGYRLRVVVTEL